MPAIEGKVALVTGVSSGIGAAIVKELVEQGMLVAGLARRIDRVEALAKSLVGKKGKLLPIKCDVTSQDDVKKAFATAEKTLGNISVLVNNAGVLKAASLTKEGAVDGVQLMMSTNVVGLATCAREGLLSMVKNKTEGTIININSVAGHFVLPFHGVGAYNASKFAVTALTEGLRNEVSAIKANIRVTSLSPGLVESEMSCQFQKEGEEGLFTEYEMLPASDIADCVTFILKSPQRMNVSEMTVSPRNETVLTQAIVAVKGMDQLL
ncbi:dehydrogenase reductase SDR family member 11-like [Nesidiocoris tenuis]|uniref:Dehydrogenase reductase SDR family member 11-like n=1 Tax=Nesidiocoris tenuis TaxID=355587 RepID=A0ABN7B400_9HEMI|nr:dehydrogenase reductase SDR family member 11-like [Nesidiocoris tenuis]